ncbi:MAG: hypothetical protein A3B68_03695 [Candidatus Melainabacteria bacterium RIFCSPHIGHO2_02_FULL_34_12]|nr:MAG: hypothetical protein A3B68_03695 [Candidatus Melainabacteria bacterium RIFCSPHIGHO2_02_FULL_34_12]
MADANISGIDNVNNDFFSRFLGMFVPGSGRKSKSKLPDSGTDEFVKDPSNINNELGNGEAKGLIAQAKALIAAIAALNNNVNPHPVAQIAKWSAILDLSLRLVTVIERAMQVAVKGTDVDRQAASLRPISTTAFSQSRENVERHKNDEKEYIKAERAPADLSTTT